jgi:hypothetical protein
MSTQPTRAQKIEATTTAATRAERERCRKILTHPAAAECLDMAAQLAFNTGWSAAKCIATLKLISADRRKRYPASAAPTNRAQARAAETSRNNAGPEFLPATIH